MMDSPAVPPASPAATPGAGGAAGDGSGAVNTCNHVPFGMVVEVGDEEAVVHACTCPVCLTMATTPAADLDAAALGDDPSAWAWYSDDDGEYGYAFFSILMMMRCIRLLGYATRVRHRAQWPFFYYDIVCC